MDTIFATCNVAAYERMQGFTMDIPGAYLNANLKDPHMVRFQKDIAAIYVNMYPEYREYLQPDGTLLLLVQKAFYGLPESSQLWYNEIRGFLIAQGFEWNPVDPGLFMKTVGDDRIILSLWVDDFLGFASKRSLIDELKAAIEERFGDSRFNDNNVLAFLGMTITQPNRHGEVFVGVEEYIKRICEQSPFELRYVADPNHKYLLRPKPKDKIEPVDSTQFLSLLMKAMWAAKRVRADVLIALSILASRGKNPDNFDMMCLEKVYCYLYSTQGMGLRFAPNSMTLHYWVDAAYALNSDDKMQSQSGIMVTIGYANAPIFTASLKQKIVTRSSTEAELVALDNSVLHLKWFSQIMEFLGYPQRPARIYQDNQNVIFVCKAGNSGSGKMKHMAIRYYFIHNEITDGLLTLHYVPTKQMVADMLTKPLDGALFISLRDKLLNF